MRLTGDAIVRLDGHPIEELRQVHWRTTRATYDAPVTGHVRVAAHLCHRQDVARKEWERMTGLFATPLRMSKPHYGGGNSHQRRKRRRAQWRQVQALLRDFGMGKPIILPCGE